MTRKRFRLGLAALGVLAAFFMALIALLLAPSLASAEKNSGTGHPYTEEADGKGHPNPIYSEHPGWHEPDKLAWNPSPVAPCSGEACGHRDDGPADFGDDSTGGGDRSADDQHGPGGQGGNPGAGGSGPSGFPNGQSGYGGGLGGGAGGGPGGSPSGSGSPNPHNFQDSNPDAPGTHDGDHDDGAPDDPTIDLTPQDPPYHDPSSFRPDPDGPQPPQDRTPEVQGPITDDTNQVPEPLTLSLFAAGLAGSVAMRRRTKAR